MVASEYAPLAKAGGLADAVAALASALRRTGADVRVLIPRYGFIPKTNLTQLPGPLGIPIGVREEWVGVYRHDGSVPVYLLEHEGFYGRRGIYNENGLDYADNARRFTLLTYGAFQLSRKLHWTPDIIHGHDWPAALTSVFLVGRERRGTFERTASLFTIHNIGYQGIFSPEQFIHAKLPWEEFPRLELHGSMNMLKGALVSADMLTTVSERYAEEVQDPRYSFGLHSLLEQRSTQIRGVLNGIDTDEWNPEEDRLIPAPFSADDLSGKSVAKRELQRRFGLAVNETIPLVGSVGRLAEQKGVRYLFDESGGGVDRLCRSEEMQMVLLGSGEPAYEERIRFASMKLPNFSAFIGYDPELAHLIEAASDFFLMPSEYEPCGLNQLYSMRYGTIPIVTATGGLADTVTDEREGANATGFVMERPSVERIVSAVGRALEMYRTDPGRILELRRNGMSRDFSWDRSARTYLSLYEEAIRLRSLA